MRAFMDTNVLVTAFRSRRGASFEVFRRLRLGQWTAVVSNHLLFEYEEILKRDAAILGLTLDAVDEILNAVCAHMDVLRPGGRWIAGSSHSIVNYVPHEDFLAMITAFHKYGQY